jgi:uncharacterized protein YciI
MADVKNHTWRDRVENAKREGLAACEFFVVLTVPAGDKAKVLETLPIHLEYQKSLEAQGILVAAGPLSDETGTEWTGKGLVVYRADDLNAARKIADADPMHKSGARTYTLLPWLMNEASFTLDIRLSGQKITLT